MADGSNNKPRTYKVLGTQQATYFDKQGLPVNGYRVKVEFYEYDEIHDFEVANLNEATVTTAIDRFIQQRAALDNL